MRSFLGVPIRAKGEVFGNLYLTDKVGTDDFTDEDEALARPSLWLRASQSTTPACMTAFAR
jgi:hypothetical protein